MSKWRSLSYAPFSSKPGRMTIPVSAYRPAIGYSGHDVFAWPDGGPSGRAAAFLRSILTLPDRKPGALTAAHPVSRLNSQRLRLEAPCGYANQITASQTALGNHGAVTSKRLTRVVWECGQTAPGAVLHSSDPPSGQSSTAPPGD
jgi:hypothetical protein